MSRKLLHLEVNPEDDLALDEDLIIFYKFTRAAREIATTNKGTSVLGSASGRSHSKIDRGYKVQTFSRQIH